MSEVHCLNRFHQRYVDVSHRRRRKDSFILLIGCLLWIPTSCRHLPDLGSGFFFPFSRFISTSEIPSSHNRFLPPNSSDKYDKTYHFLLICALKDKRRGDLNQELVPEKRRSRKNWERAMRSFDPEFYSLDDSRLHRASFREKIRKFLLSI
ncbi:hypothetical protein CDAR_579751 [Caerostris darwini]|uniref:Ycf2 n=1 Tax=Caerostris darwini TaxID=1538125 RepID=A0AAV4PW67_9ARAC|nr:hypothetical protein CDAR_579751 [Caerostris darwini]